MLSREQILRADDLPTEVVNVARWGGPVLVRAINIGNPDYVARVYALDAEGNPPNAAELHYRRMVFAVILSALDDEGRRLFKWEDADELRRKHWNSVLRVAEESFRLAGPDTDDVGLKEGKELSEPTLD